MEKKAKENKPEKYQCEETLKNRGDINNIRNADK